jgi:stage V sporulation protein R
MHEKGLVTDGFMLEVLSSHSNVVAQRGFDERGYGGMNPYALGFAMMRDLRRICESPTTEDREWFPDIAGGNWHEVLDFAMRNFKDESFIGQYLSPKLIREFRLFAIADHESQSHLEVDSIHDDDGYRRVRKLLAEQNNRDRLVPDIQVVRYRRESDRGLVLRHQVHRGRRLDDDSANQVLTHLVRLWGFTVELEEVDESGRVIAGRVRAAPQS